MKPMYRILLGAAAALCAVVLAGCAGQESGRTYTRIDQQTAMRMMEQDDGHRIVDVRRREEYEAGHIPGAILIPNESITDTAPAELPDRDQILLIYCRSGNRSRQAAQKLADLGYTRVYEFGGINTWPGETVTGETQAPETQPPETHTPELEVQLRLSTFGGGGPEYRAVPADPEIVSVEVGYDPGAGSHGTEAGARYDVVFTLRGLRPGETELTVVGESPILPPETRRYAVTVAEDLRLRVTPIRSLSRLYVYRNGSINYEFYEIESDETGYVLTISERESRPIPPETADALCAVIDKYGLEQWDGFSKSQSGVLDGEGFRLEIELTDGTRILASGDNAFPPDYFNAMGELWAILEAAAGS